MNLQPIKNLLNIFKRHKGHSRKIKIKCPLEHTVTIKSVTSKGPETACVSACVSASTNAKQPCPDCQNIFDRLKAELQAAYPEPIPGNRSIK